jgi:hypothetical protein
MFSCLLSTPAILPRSAIGDRIALSRSGLFAVDQPVVYRQYDASNRITRYLSPEFVR